MSCYFHASKESVGARVNCGKLICAARDKEIEGKSYCPVCMEELFTAKVIDPVPVKQEAPVAIAAIKKTPSEPKVSEPVSAAKT